MNTMQCHEYVMDPPYASKVKKKKKTKKFHPADMKSRDSVALSIGAHHFSVLHGHKAVLSRVAVSPGVLQSRSSIEALLGLPAEDLVYKVQEQDGLLALQGSGQHALQGERGGEEVDGTDPLAVVIPVEVRPLALLVEAQGRGAHERLHGGEVPSLVERVVLGVEGEYGAVCEHAEGLVGAKLDVCFFFYSLRWQEK